MSYLLDTNVICEIWKKAPEAKVVDWLKAIPSEKLFLSVLSIGEIRRGVEKLPKGKKRPSLLQWLEDELPRQFRANILNIDIAVAEKWGFICAESKNTLPAIDSLLAATALHHDLRLVTRNEKDFKVPGLEIINPF